MFRPILQIGRSNNNNNDGDQSAAAVGRRRESGRVVIRSPLPTREEIENAFITTIGYLPTKRG